jgi:hypothetical protein
MPGTTNKKYRRKLPPPYVGVGNGADSLKILALHTIIHYSISQNTQRSSKHLFHAKGRDKDKHFFVQVMKAHWGVWLNSNHS